MKPRIFGIETEYGVHPLQSFNPVDFFLPNGGRLYDDGNHPEYATPECRNPRDLVIYDKAGEHIVQSHFKGNTIEYRFFKHSTDGQYAYFGCHENYSSTHVKNTFSLVPFLITRQVFTGSGWLSPGGFQLSQRVYYIAQNCNYRSGFVTIKNGCTTRRRRCERYHVLSGEANMSEIATYLKVGTTALMFDLLEDGKLPFIGMKNRAQQFLSLSRDQTCQWLVHARWGSHKNERPISAVDILEMYLERADKYVSKDAVTDDILTKWSFVLDRLKKDPLSLHRWLDWPLKKLMLTQLAENAGVSIQDNLIKSADIEYHDVDRSCGHFYRLQRAGLVDRLVTDEEINDAVINPPSDTRALLRSKAVKKRWHLDGGSWCDMGGEVYIHDPFQTIRD